MMRYFAQQVKAFWIIIEVVRKFVDHNFFKIRKPVSLDPTGLRS